MLYWNCQKQLWYFTELIENEEKLKKENAALKEQLKKNSISQDSFEEDNDKVLFYTGLPNWTLLAITLPFQFCERFITVILEF